MARFPTAPTVSNWLKQFTQATLAPLIQLNHDLVLEAITKRKLPRLTVDGTVVCTGAKCSGPSAASIRTIASI